MEFDSEKHPDGVLRGHLDSSFALERVARARAAADEERSMGFGSVVRKYWKAAAWSMTLSTALVMEGYDVGIVGLPI